MADDFVESDEAWNVDFEIVLHLHQISQLNRSKSKDAGWTLVVKAVLLTSELTTETGKVQVTSLIQNVDQKLILPLATKTAKDLDELIYYPLLINFYENINVAVVKDKKKPPEEKLELLGQISVDFMPFIEGETTIEGTWIICLTSQSGEALRGDQAESRATDPPECKLSIHIEKPLIPLNFDVLYNILTLTVYSCYSFPETWMPVPGSKAQTPGFTIATAIPRRGVQERFLIAQNKTVQPKATHHTLSFKRWPYHPQLTTDAGYMREKLSAKDYFVETGSFSDPASWIQRDTTERTRPCLPINTEFRCILSKASEAVFRSKAMALAVWPIEVFEVAQPEKHSTAKKKTTLEGAVNANSPDDPFVNHHGVAFVNVKPLLYPGATRIIGAYPIEKYDAESFAEKTKRTTLAGQIVASASKLPQEKETRQSVASRKTELQHHPKATTASDHPETSFLLYEENKTYIYLEITVRRPLIEKVVNKTAVETLKQIATPVASRSVLPESSGVELAIVALRKQFTLMYSLFGKLYRQEKLNAENTQPNKERAGSDSPQSRGNLSAGKGKRDQMLQNIERRLTLSGDYHAMKEQLKLYVIRIVREKHGMTEPILDPIEFDRLLVNLYKEFMHEARVSFTALQRSSYEFPADVIPAKSLQNLRILALEAEIDGDYIKARGNMLERSSIAPKDQRVWKDLGLFFMRHGKLDEAEAAVRQILLDNYTNFEGIALFGYVYLERGDFGTAAVIFEALQVLYPTSALAWTTLGLFYEMCTLDPSGSTTIKKEHAFHEASQAIGTEDMRLEMYKEFLKHIEEKHLASAVNNSIELNKPQLQQQLASSRAIKSAEIKSLPKVALKKDAKSQSPTPFGVADSGKPREFVRPEPIFNHISAEPVPEQQHHAPFDNIFWCAISAFANLGMHRMTNICAEHLMESCDILDPVYWRSGVLSLMEQRKYEEAKKLLQQVMMSDVETADIFASLGHVNYLQENYKDAEENYGRALSLATEVSDPFQLYYRYARLLERYGHFKKAKEMFFRVARLHPTCQTLLGCGRACYYLADYENAEQALQEANYLDNKEPRVWAYLAIFCYRNNKDNLAERCYRVAKVFGIENYSLTFQELKKARIKPEYFEQ